MLTLIKEKLLLTVNCGDKISTSSLNKRVRRRENAAAVDTNSTPQQQENQCLEQIWQITQLWVLLRVLILLIFILLCRSDCCKTCFQSKMLNKGIEEALLKQRENPLRSWDSSINYDFLKMWGLKNVLFCVHKLKACIGEFSSKDKYASLSRERWEVKRKHFSAQDDLN